MILRAAVFIAALLFGGLAAWHAYLEPRVAAQIAGISATVLAVLVAVSMAIFAVLSVSAQAPRSGSAGRRIKSLIDKENSALIDQQMAIFYAILIALILNITMDAVVKFLDARGGQIDFGVRLLAACCGFFTGLSLVLAFFMPSCLVGIIHRDRDLNKH